MQYQSTRNKSMRFSSSQVIKQGLAQDGGLFVPVSQPSVTLAELADMSKVSYNERAYRILSKFLTDFTEPELRECINNAYTKEKFETEAVAPVYKLNEDTFILELWHGPTCAFKDMALQILPHLLTQSAKKTGENKEIVILVATSGDTGKAALEGFKDVAGTRIMVFYPENGVSEIQKLQMITQEGNNVHVAAVAGNFDDAQNGVKAIFTDTAYKALLESNNLMLSSANSINWGRLVPQIVYYFSAYADMLNSKEIELGQAINIVVPTGNFGNILAAYYAYKMGLPVHKLVCASNENNVLTEFIKTGVYDRNRKFFTTISPSMDILISSNLERLLFDVSGEDDELITKLMKNLAENGRYEIPYEMKEKISGLFWAGSCDDASTMKTIKDTYEAYGYVIDTHTAVGKKIYDDYKDATGDTHKTIVASTASPFKFNQSVIIALEGHQVVAGKDEFTLLSMLSEKSGMKTPKSLADLQTKPVIYDMSCKKEQMQQVVSDFLKIE